MQLSKGAAQYCLLRITSQYFSEQHLQKLKALLLPLWSVYGKDFKKADDPLPQFTAAPGKDTSVIYW